MSAQTFTIQINVDEIAAKIAEQLMSRMASHTPSSTSSEYYTQDDLCQTLGISKPTLIQYQRTGKIKGYRIGRRVLYKKHEVDQALTLIQTA